MPQSIKALINSQLLTWARESAGFRIEELAHKLRVPKEKLEAWETGSTALSVPQLRKFAEACKRPLACFYLPEPPKGGPQPIRDLRRLHGSSEFHDTVALNLEVRLADYRRQIALELMADIGEKPHEIKQHISIKENPEDISVRIRKFLGIDFQQQTSWTNANEGFNQWRAAIERFGILVFQTGEISVKEVRGFSISQHPLPVIMLNTKDYYPARIFTLIHELAHILLNQSGICDIYEEYRRNADDQKIEVFCNHVAGATLVPEKEFREEHEALKKSGRASNIDEYAQALANRFKVSREVIFRRYLAFAFINQEQYEKKRDQLQKEFAEQERRARESAKEFRRIMHREVVSKCGLPFVQFVLGGYHQEKITLADVSEFLNVKVKFLRKVESEATSKAVKFGSFL